MESNSGPPGPLVLPLRERQEAETISILLVATASEDRRALRSVVAPLDLRIVEASSSGEALHHSLEEDLAVIVLDLLEGGPGLDGIELAHAIRQGERTAAVPILLLTAMPADDEQHVHERAQIRALDFLAKPLQPERLRAKVAMFAELYRQRQHGLEVERRESALRRVDENLANERRYQSLADAVPNIIWTARTDGAVDYLNRRWFEYTGLSPGQTAGSWASATHPDDANLCRTAWREAMTLGHACQLELRLRGADGSYRWHLGRALPVKSATGQIVSWLGTFTDIEDQKRSASALAEFKGTLDAVHDAVLIMAPEDWRFLYVNLGASTLLGYSREALLQMRAPDIMVQDDAATLRTRLSSLQSGSNATVAIETDLRRRDDTTVPVEISLQLIAINGGRIVSIARDISERKRAQHERETLHREAMGARDEFISIAAHELRSPLSSLQLQIQSLLRPSRSDARSVLSVEQIRSRLELAAKQCDRINRLIGELMDVSRITSGRLALEREPLDLAALVRDTTARLGDDAAKARCPVQLSAPAPVIGSWDPLRVEQVVTNLLTNAFKFAAGQPVEVAVEERGAIGRLIVRDHGVGIPPDDIERIFQRYEQGRSTGGAGGLGLGLYIVRQIVEAHGGNIRVDSMPGAGATFTVELLREPPLAS